MYIEMLLVKHYNVADNITSNINYIPVRIYLKLIERQNFSLPILETLFFESLEFPMSNNFVIKFSLTQDY